MPAAKQSLNQHQLKLSGQNSGAPVMRLKLFFLSFTVFALQTTQCVAHAQMYYYQQDEPGGFAGRARDASFSNGFAQTPQTYAPRQPVPQPYSQPMQQSYSQPVQQAYSQPVQQSYPQPAEGSFNTAASLERMLDTVDTSNNWAPSQTQYRQQPSQQYQQPQQYQQQFQQPQQIAMQQRRSAPQQFHSYMQPQSVPNAQYYANRAPQNRSGGGGPIMNTWQRIFPGVSKQEMMRVFLEGGTPQSSGGYQASAPSSGQSSGDNSQARSTAYSNYQTAANEETKSRNWANTAHYDKDKWRRKDAATRAYYAANNANYAAQRAESAANSSGDSQARGYANSARACANRARYNSNQARYNADTIQ